MKRKQPDGGVFKINDFAALRALEGAGVERVLVHGQLKAAARAFHGVKDGVVLVLIVILFVLIVVAAAAGAGALIKFVFELSEIVADLLHAVGQVDQRVLRVREIERKIFQNVDDDMEQLALAAVLLNAHALGKTLQIGHFFGCRHKKPSLC